MLSSSSQGESSVTRVRLEGHKNPYEYALAEWICISGSVNTHHFHLVCICNGFLMTLKSDSQPSTVNLRTAPEKNSALF